MERLSDRRGCTSFTSHSWASARRRLGAVEEVGCAAKRLGNAEHKSRLVDRFTANDGRFDGDVLNLGGIDRKNIGIERCEVGELADLQRSD